MTACLASGLLAANGSSLLLFLGGRLAAENGLDVMGNLSISMLDLSNSGVDNMLDMRNLMLNSGSLGSQMSDSGDQSGSLRSGS